jgi:8-oxo-dGTP pyrophosphatase MutT (NUDIX family)
VLATPEPSPGRAAMLLIVTDDRNLLLHKRDDKAGIPHPGCWSGFGGAAEDGESVEDAVRREVFEETGLKIAEPVFLAEEVDAEGDGRLVSLFYVVGGIAPGDIDLREGAGVGVHAIGDLDRLPVAPFVLRAVRSHLVPVLGSFRLRAAAAADIDALIALWLEAAENFSRPTDTRQAAASLLDRDPEAVIVAEHDGELIGSVIAGWDGWRCHLYRLAVRPHWRRKGVASALLEAAENRFRALGGNRADAMVLDSNDLGRDFWLGSGYRRQDDWRRWVKTLG